MENEQRTLQQFTADVLDLYIKENFKRGDVFILKDESQSELIGIYVNHGIQDVDGMKYIIMHFHKLKQDLPTYASSSWTLYDEKPGSQASNFALMAEIEVQYTICQIRPWVHAPFFNPETRPYSYFLKRMGLDKKSQLKGFLYKELSKRLIKLKEDVQEQIQQKLFEHFTRSIQEDEEAEQQVNITPEMALSNFLRELGPIMSLQETDEMNGYPQTVEAWSKMNQDEQEIIKFIGEVAQRNQPVRIYYNPKVTTGKVVNRTIYPYSLRMREIHVNGYDMPTIPTPVLFGYDPFKKTIKMFVVARIGNAQVARGSFSPRWDVELEESRKLREDKNKDATSNMKYWMDVARRLLKN